MEATKKMKRKFDNAVAAWIESGTTDASHDNEVRVIAMAEMLAIALDDDPDWLIEMSAEEYYAKYDI